MKTPKIQQAMNKLLRKAQVTGRLRVVERFDSIQGEGRHMGMLSHFVRLAYCPFRCEWCDTFPNYNRPTITFEPKDLGRILATKLYDLWSFTSGKSAVVFTGGDPLLYIKQLCQVMDTMAAHNNDAVDHYAQNIQIETQGYFHPLMDHPDNVISPDHKHHLQQVCYNVSPKLTNSGIPRAMAVQPEVLEFHRLRDRDCFKFVCDSPANISEAADFCTRHRIPRERAYIMPQTVTRTGHAVKCEELVKHAVNFGFNFSPRLQVAIWDKTIGV